MEIKGLVAGLGNPGSRYANTLHNCGFMFIERLLAVAEKEGYLEELSGKKFDARLWRARFDNIGQTWLACEPQTFMNESGRAIRAILAWHKLSPSQLLVAQDEMDIPAGQLRFKHGGGLAGHNGLVSITQLLGTPDFYRLRIGIGHPPRKEQTLDWVLGRPSGEDKEKISKALDAALKVFFTFCEDGSQAAMQLARACKG